MTLPSPILPLEHYFFECIGVQRLQEDVPGSDSGRLQDQLFIAITSSSSSAAAAEKRLDACGRILYSCKINCGAIFRLLVKECLLSRSRIPDDEKVTWIMKK